MNTNSSYLKLLGIVFLGFSVWQCAEEPIEYDLSHLNLHIDTLTVNEITGESYLIEPNLGSHTKLYFGEKNNRSFPVTFIKFSDPIFWKSYFDSTITFDSLELVLYSNDSTIGEIVGPNLYFSPDSHFSELSTVKNDISSLSFSEWTNLSIPSIDVKTDTAGIFTHTEFTWDLLPIVTMLTDTLDSNLVRTFALNYDNSLEDSIFIELLSREATSGSKDPKINLYYRLETTIDEDSTTIDTSIATIYTTADLSVISSEIIFYDSSEFSLDYGQGRRAIMYFPFDSLEDGALIRSANLLLNIDTTIGGENAIIIFDPVDVPMDTGTFVFETDPYESIGYPYRVSSKVSNGEFKISLKSFLQNVSMGNETNIGFKVLSDVTNSPFETIYLDSNSAKLEIVYVSN